MGVRWSEEDTQALVEMRDDGESVERCAVALGRSAEAVRVRLRKLGMPSGSARRDIGELVLLASRHRGEIAERARFLRSIGVGEGAVNAACGAICGLTEDEMGRVMRKYGEWL